MGKMENLNKKVKKEIEKTDIMLDFLIQMGDTRALYVKKVTELYRTAGELSINPDITDEQFKKLVNMMEQFNKVLNDFKEKEGI